MNPKNNGVVIHLVVCTVCILAIIGVTTEALCAFWKIPDMSGSLSSGFTHAVDTILGALIALLINTRAQDSKKDDTLPQDVKITNPPEDPANVKEQK